MEYKPHISWKPILQVHWPHWLSHSLSHYPPGCRFQQLFISPQRIHLYQSISEQCGLTDNYRMESHLHSTTLSKIQKIYTSPVGHFSFPHSTLLHRIPEGSLPLLCSCTRRRLPGPLTSLLHVTTSFKFTLPLSSRQCSSFLLNPLPFSVNIYFSFCFESSSHENHRKVDCSDPIWLIHPVCSTTSISMTKTTTWHDTGSQLSGPGLFIFSMILEPYTLSNLVLVIHTGGNNTGLHGSHILVHENRWFKSTHKQRNA